MDALKLESTKEMENTADNSAKYKEITVSEAYAEIDRADKLADVANKTTDREEFYNAISEIESILTELSKYERKFNFSYPPSANLRDLRRGKNKQIELLEKRIAEKERETTIGVPAPATDSNQKYNHDDYYKNIAKQKENNLQITYNDVECYDLRPFDLNKPFMSDGHFTAITLEGDNLEKAYGYLKVVNDILMPFKHLFENALFPDKIGTDYRFGRSDENLPVSHLRLSPYTATMKKNKYPFWLWLSYCNDFGSEYIYMIYFNQQGEIGKCDLSLHGCNDARISYESKIRRNENGLYVMRINKTLYVEPYGTKIIYHYHEDKDFQNTQRLSLCQNKSNESMNLSVTEKEPSKEVELVESNTGKTFDVENHGEKIAIDKVKINIEALEMKNVVSDVKPQEDIQRSKPYKYLFPTISLLNKSYGLDDYWKKIRQRAEKLNQTFQAFGVKADIVDISHGARFTRFEIQIGKGVRIKDILKIEDDLKLNLETANIHIEAPIPGRTTIGIDVENKELSIVTFREMIESKEFREFPSNLALAIGKDVTGNIIVESLENMCHLLIGGTTGSGKSVCISNIIMSILYKAHPNEVKFILIDTKAINLFIYDGIPHLLIPVVTDLKKATAALHWCIVEMTNRYRKFSDFGVRNLAGYNKMAEKSPPSDEQLQKMPRIVIIIDDFSDLMVADNRNAEESICRLAQMGRACGIHLIISTQRPSVDVITGIIKTNIPSRIAFNVFSAIDSKTILDTKGAENLLTNGDMLFYPQGARTPLRVQGTYVSDTEIGNVVDFVKNQMVRSLGVDYEKKAEQTQVVNDGNELDPYFIEAGRFVIDKDKASIGMIQRVFKIGFNRAARIMDQLEKAGVVGSEPGTKPRAILMSTEQFELLLREKYKY